MLRSLMSRVHSRSRRDSAPAGGSLENAARNVVPWIRLGSGMNGAKNLPGCDSRFAGIMLPGNGSRVSGSTIALPGSRSLKSPLAPAGWAPHS